MAGKKSKKSRKRTAGKKSKSRAEARVGAKAKAGSGARRKGAGTRALFGKALAALDRQAKARERKVRDELRRLAQIIRTAKAEVAAIRSDEVKGRFVNTATDELDAIVAATAEATNAIMDATEGIEKVMGALQGDAATGLMDATTKIYEACGFQDITGQRISKVVKAIKEIEARIDALNAAFEADVPPGGRAGGKEAAPAPKPGGDGGPKPITDADLLNGPQLRTKAKTQEEIDAMLTGSGR